jgi:hypothetical protein
MTYTINHLPKNNLIEIYCQPKEEIELREHWNRMEDKSLFLHAVYNIINLELTYYSASSEDFLFELKEKNFLSGWNEIIDSPESIKRMYKTTFPLPVSKAPRKLSLTKQLEEILESTYGYLLYQEQITAILMTVKQADSRLIPMYITNWNLKKPTTRLMASTVYLGKHTLDEIIEDRAYDSENQFLYA